MKDEELDRMVRDADPYRPGVIDRLDRSDQALLQEIVTVAAVRAPRRRTRLAIVRFGAGALAGAAVLTGVLALPTVLRDRPANSGAAPAESTTVSRPDDRSASAAARPTPPTPAPGRNDYPRLLIDQPSWKVTTTYGFADEYGTIAFGKGRRELEMNWYRAADYDSYYTDRLEVSAPEKVHVNGWPGNLFRYSGSDFAIMLNPRDGTFVEMRTSGSWNRQTFDQVVADVHWVDARTWLAALPDDIVTPDRMAAEAATMLADVPLPPSFDITELGNIGVNDQYQFGVHVVGQVGCGWIAEWLRAKQAGDDAALRRASDALRSSHDWRVLRDMAIEGDWPEILFWQIADDVAAENPPAGYRKDLNCK